MITVTRVLAVWTERLLRRRQDGLLGRFHENLGFDAFLLADLFDHVLKGKRALLLHDQLPT